MLTTEDEKQSSGGVRPPMTIEEQVQELRGVVCMLAHISGPWVVEDVKRLYPYFFLPEG